MNYDKILTTTNKNSSKKDFTNMTEDERILFLIKWFAMIGIPIVILLILLFGGFYTVSAGERAILTTFGKPSMEVRGEGLHFKIPIVQRAKIMEVRIQKIEANADSVSKDLQNLQTTIALNYHLSPEEVPKLYQEIGGAYKERIINPAIQESVKAVTAKFTAEELITRRSEVRQKMQELLKQRLSEYFIVVDDFNIINFRFSEEFAEAIEAKVIAEQMKLKAERDLERIKVEKQQRIAQAEAEAEALRLQKLVITPDLIKLRQIEVQKLAIEVQLEAIRKWTGILPQVTSGIPFIGFDLNQLNTNNQTI